MARLGRLAVAGQPHHLLQRGHNRGTVFADAEDRRLFLRLLAEAARSTGMAVHGYVLLDDAVHLLVTPAAADSLSRAMQALGRNYGQQFNRRHRRSGTLWDGRFKAALVEPDPWALLSLAWIESAPLVARLASQAQDFPWSSATHHLGLRVDPLITEHRLYWRLGNTPFEREAAWRQRLDTPVTARQASELLSAVERGWALGSDPYLLEMARQAGRALRPRPRGRPARRDDDGRSVEA